MGPAMLPVLFTACLPADTRAAPGELTMTVSPSDATLHGIATADGWTITFDRVLVSMGHTTLDDDCNSYSDARYYRLLDLGAGSGQTLSLLFGLGTCDLQFRFAPPDADAVLGAGITDADEMYMRTPLQDDGYNIDSGVALDVVGSAARDGAVSRFHWSFRQNIRYGNCTFPGASGSGSGVTLLGGDHVTYDIRMPAEALFRDNVDPEHASLHFAPFAAADALFGNADGEVSLDELRRVPGFVAATDATGIGVSWRPATSIAPPSADGGAPIAVDAGAAADSIATPVAASLADFVYVFLVPSMPLFRDGGRCETFPPQQLVRVPVTTPPAPG